MFTVNENGDKGEDDATTLPKDHGDDSKNGSGNGLDDHDGHEDPGAASDDSNDQIVLCGTRAVQLLAICANFRICAINAYDWRAVRCVYRACEGEVQEEGMVDLVLIGPGRIIEAFGSFGLNVFTANDDGSCTDPPINEGWCVAEDEEVEEYTRTIYGGLGRKIEITYLVVPDAIETNIEVRLNLKDLGSRNRVVYGTIKARAIDYGNKSVHLFSCERGRRLSFPCGSTSILPLSPYVIALPYRQHFKLYIEMDLGVITTYDSQEENKNMKFYLDFSRRIRSQKREVGGDQVEVNITWYLERRL